MNNEERAIILVRIVRSEKNGASNSRAAATEALEAAELRGRTQASEKILKAARAIGGEDEQKFQEMRAELATWVKKDKATIRTQAIKDCIVALTEHRVLMGAPMISAVACLNVLLDNTKEKSKECKHKWHEAVGICTKCGIPMSTGRC